MTDVWRASLERVRDKLEALPKGLYHLLVDLDKRYLPRPHTLRIEDFAQDRKYDPECQDTIGLLPDPLWRPSSGNQDILASDYVWGPDDRVRRHVFYGPRDDFASFEIVAREAVDCLWSAPPSPNISLPKREQIGVHPDAALLLARLVHELAWQKIDGSPLRANRYTWGDGLIVDYDNDDEVRRELGIGATSEGAPSTDELRSQSMEIDHLRYWIDLVGKSEGHSVRHRADTLSGLHAKLASLENDLEKGRERLTLQYRRERLRGRIVYPLDYFCSILTSCSNCLDDDDLRDLATCSAWAIDSILSHQPTSFEHEKSGASAGVPKTQMRLFVEHVANASAITLDGARFNVADEVAAYVAALQRENGGWLSSREICEREPSLRLVAKGKLGRDIRDKLPNPVRKLIESRPGAGSRLKLD